MILYTIYYEYMLTFVIFKIDLNNHVIFHRRVKTTCLMYCASERQGTNI